MSLWKALAMGPVFLAMLAAGARAQAPKPKPTSPPRPDDAPMVKLSEQLRAPGPTGKWKEVGVDAGKTRISAVPRLRLDERAVPTRASAILAGESSASVDWRRLQGEVSQRFGDLEGCRNKIARQEKVTVENLRAGLVVLRWTILPSGRTAGTVVYQQRETELSLVKCIRARMDAWQFTPASSDPIVIEQTYDFKAALLGITRQPVAAAAAAKPAPTAPAAPAPAARKKK